MNRPPMHPSLVELTTWEIVRLRHTLDVAAAQARELAGKIPHLAELAGTLDALSLSSTVAQPRRQNKPPQYRELAIYAGVAFGSAAFDLHRKGEKLTVDRVMAEIFGSTRTGGENYANDLRRPWLPLCGRSWDQARSLLERGLSLIGRGAYQVFTDIEDGLEPWVVLGEVAARNAPLRDEAAADAAWQAAGVKRSLCGAERPPSAPQTTAEKCA
jgi:hypothetical protein